ncbi:hypothetical protein [Methanobacterium oryzae]|uniref:hypothetical protein n=1 Tax=Methanobacterium oryzae TaxID=69540 RepID=UPI003D192871
MKNQVILIVSILTLFLTFCSTINAHPGHGDYYPEEITNTTSPDPTVAPISTGTSSTGTSTSKTTYNTKKNTENNEYSSQDKDTSSQNTENTGNSAEPYEEVVNNSTNKVTSSADSESIPWNIIAPIGGIIGGFGAVGILFKSGILK